MSVMSKVVEYASYAKPVDIEELAGLHFTKYLFCVTGSYA